MQKAASAHLDRAAHGNNVGTRNQRRGVGYFPKRSRRRRLISDEVVAHCAGIANCSWWMFHWQNMEKVYRQHDVNVNDTLKIIFSPFSVIVAPICIFATFPVSIVKYSIDGETQLMPERNSCESEKPLYLTKDEALALLDICMLAKTGANAMRERAIMRVCVVCLEFVGIRKAAGSVVDC
jgi:hypothetical protein